MVFTSERDPRRHSAPHDDKGAIASGTDQHRYRGTLPGVTRGLAVYNYVPGQRLPSPTTLRDSGQSAPAVLTVVKCFVADMGVPSAFRRDIGSEHTNQAFAEYCDGLEIRRILTAPYTPQQNDPV